MKKRILMAINELNIASFDELALILKDYFGNIRKATLKNNLDLLEKERSVFRLEDNDYQDGFQGYILGPNARVEGEDDDISRIKDIVLERELKPRDLSFIKWKNISKKILTKLVRDVEKLKNNIQNLSEEPRKLELEYFDLSIKYHEYYGFFYQNYSADFLLPIGDKIKECRSYLDKLIVEK